jgi:hypothetical protein
MPAADEESKRLRSLRPRRRRLGPETPLERGPSQGELAPAFEHSGNRTIDDGIGETPASQFVGDLQTAATPVEQELLGTTFREGDVIDVAALHERLQGRCNDGSVDGASGEMLGDLGVRTRRTREVVDRYGHGRRRIDWSDRSAIA